MSDTSLKDPAYDAVLDDFKALCQDTILHYHDTESLLLKSDESKTKRKNALHAFNDNKYSLNTNFPETTPLPNEIMLLMSQLAFWIYTPNDLPIPKPVGSFGLDHWNYKKIVLTHKTQISQWAFLQFSGKPNDAYLVFKGTDPDKIFDIMADTAVIPMPMWCEQDPHESVSDTESDEWQFCGHSGIYATLMRDYRQIYKIINSRIESFRTLYVIGHSMGGGMAILFGLESIMKKHLPPDKSMKIVTFGSPAVISYENDFGALSQSAKRVLWNLHNICHCFVNRFDPVARVPARIEWLMTVIPYALKKILADQVKTTMKLPSFMVPLVKSGVKSGVSKFVEYVEKYFELLRSYHPIGTHYFCAGKDGDHLFITRNLTAVEEIMGFIPPHKIVTSDGQELRVTHFSTRAAAHHTSVFSLENVTDLINSNRDKIFNDEDDDHAMHEEKMDILSLLKRENGKNDDDDLMTAMSNSSSLYVAVNNIEENHEYKSKKLSEKGWVMLVSNHMVEQYIDIFKAKVQTNYPERIVINMMGSPQQSKVNTPVAEMYENARQLWNQVTQKEDVMKKDPENIPALPKRQRRYANYILHPKPGLQRRPKSALPKVGRLPLPPQHKASSRRTKSNNNLPLIKSSNTSPLYRPQRYNSPARQQHKTAKSDRSPIIETILL
eukprot:113131_1